MAESGLILHHYDFSNFSEKVRLVLALKNITWDSVIIPSHLPKPDYLPLTAGYRRTPALQKGSDIYCDTRLIARFLDDFWPDPPLYPPKLNVSEYSKCKIIEDWAETNFIRPIALYITGVNARKFPMKFHNDRANLHGKGSPSIEQVNKAGFRYKKQVELYMDWVNNLLTDKSDFFHGPSVSLTDIVLYEGPWFLEKISGNCDFLKGRARLERWFAKMSELSSPPRRMLSAKFAINLALNSEPETCSLQIDAKYHILKGTKVKVSALGQNACAHGRLVYLDSEKICISIESERTALVHVHFPREGYFVRAI